MAEGNHPRSRDHRAWLLELNIDQVTTDKDHKIVLYCGGGSCSALAVYMLQRMGFRNVFSLAGIADGKSQSRASYGSVMERNQRCVQEREDAELSNLAGTLHLQNRYR